MSKEQNNQEENKALHIGGVRQRLLNCIIRIVGDIEETDNVMDEYLDDLDFVEIIMESELEFDVAIQEQDKRIGDFETIKDLIDWLEPNVANGLYMKSADDRKLFYILC